MRLHFLTRFALVALATSAVAPPAARADWLVGTDGSRLEIKGPWTVKGKVVTFTMTNGTLGSLRLGDVDLEKSAQATAEAQAKAAAAVAPDKPAATKAPVMVLRDEDVKHSSDSPEAAPAEGAPAAAKAAEPAAPANPVVVTAWDKGYSELDNGVTLTGTVRNGGKRVEMGVNVLVKLYDETGALAGTAEAVLNADSLPPGQASNFRAVVPGVQSFVAAKFEVTSTPVETGQPSESEAASPPQ